MEEKEGGHFPAVQLLGLCVDHQREVIYLEADYI